MTYYTSPFGNGVLVGSGGNVTSNVHNQFGSRDTGGTQGVAKVEGITEQLIFNVDTTDFNDGIDSLVAYVIPAGAVIKAAYVDVEVAAAMTGTTPTVLIGTSGSEATNGLVLSEAIVEGTGTSNVTSTLAGTWDAEVPLAADTTIGVALGGTTPTVADGGKIRVTIVYDRANLSL